MSLREIKPVKIACYGKKAQRGYRIGLANGSRHGSMWQSRWARSAMPEKGSREDKHTSIVTRRHVNHLCSWAVFTVLNILRYRKIRSHCACSNIDRRLKPLIWTVGSHVTYIVYRYHLKNDIKRMSWQWQTFGNKVNALRVYARPPY